MEYKVILDHVGRTTIGKVVSDNSEYLELENPVILHCQPEPNGSIQVQTFPLFFFEFLDKNNRNTNIWKYAKSNIVDSQAILDEKVIQQYEKLNTPAPQFEPTSKNINPKVISINDL